MGKVATIGVAFVAGLTLLVAAGAVAVVQSIFGGSSRADCAPAVSAGSGTGGLDAQQTTNAAVIVAVGKQMNVPAQGWVIAIAAAIQESGLRNLDHGDRDSLGLFQQRPSQGWGTPEQIMNPTYAATQFYQHLVAVDGWQQMSLNDSAQAVQHSGTPNAYAQHEQLAHQIVAAAQGVSCTITRTGDCRDIQAANPVAMAAINFACGQRGLPYVWGGNGGTDGGFDCSGLTTAAYNAAGLTLPRTADAQFRAGPRVPAGQPLLLALSEFPHLCSLKFPSWGVLSARRLRWSAAFGRRFAVLITAVRRWRLDALAGGRRGGAGAARSGLVDLGDRPASWA